VLYLIDGSNLLGNLGKLGMNGSELALLAKIDRFCTAHGHSALVVFDTMKDRDAGSRFSFGRKTQVKIPRQKVGKDRADRVLIAEVRKRWSGHPRIVVTDDRALASSVRHNGVTVTSSSKFMEQLSTPSREHDTMSTEKESAARGIDNAELLRIWSAEQPEEHEEV
jgi:predicted RNA-binding protein with PIN domain